MHRSTPPFRADHVGSLLRSAALKEARAKRERGEISAEELRLVEDREIEALIGKQEAIGLQSITDGEYRRASWQTDFLTALAGVEAYFGEREFRFQGAQPRPIRLRINRKLGSYAPHPMVEHFRFLKTHTSRTPKMTIPSPSTLHFRYGRRAVPESIYPAMDEFYRDLGETYRQCVQDFADAGCRYLQFDEVNLAYLCDPELRRQVAVRGDDPDKLPSIYAAMINAAISGVPADMTIAMHLCRGNFRSSFVATGGYEPIAELLFNQINVQAYFMEYDTERAGGFEPLRFVPKGKSVVLGLVTTKTGVLEHKDELKRRIEAAARYVDLEQLCLSPQCGFASTEEGQHARRAAAMGEACHDRGGGGRNLELKRRRPAAARCAGSRGPQGGRRKTLLVICARASFPEPTGQCRCCTTGRREETNHDRCAADRGCRCRNGAPCIVEYSTPVQNGAVGRRANRHQGTSCLRRAPAWTGRHQHSRHIRSAQAEDGIADHVLASLVPFAQGAGGRRHHGRQFRARAAQG